MQGVIIEFSRGEKKAIDQFVSRANKLKQKVHVLMEFFA